VSALSVVFGGLPYRTSNLWGGSTSLPGSSLRRMLL